MRADYGQRKAELLPKVLESFAAVSADADIVIVEGAGSPAEINLRAGDIANMGFAAAAGVPVVIVGDIDRGGVIASLVGTHAVLDRGRPHADRGLRRQQVSRRRGLFADGVAMIEAKTGWPSLGVVPWFADARPPAGGGRARAARAEVPPVPLVVAVPMLPRIANFDDLDPLRLEPACRADRGETRRADSAPPTSC